MQYKNISVFVFSATAMFGVSVVCMEPSRRVRFYLPIQENNKTPDERRKSMSILGRNKKRYSIQYGS